MHPVILPGTFFPEPVDILEHLFYNNYAAREFIGVPCRIFFRSLKIEYFGEGAESFSPAHRPGVLPANGPDALAGRNVPVFFRERRHSFREN